MDILMIGHSRSGKTSYMAGLYKEFGNKERGIGIWTSDSSKQSKLKRIADNISRGIYPTGTDIASEYDFWLQIDNRLVIPFNWYDYRGGALSESSKTSRDAQKLIEKIENADALIVFLDGEKIVEDTDEDAEDDYEILLWAIQKAVSRKHLGSGNYFPISFVITKGDLYSDYSPLYDSDGLEYFTPFFKTIRDGNTVAGMISICEVAKTGVYNVFAPLLFSLYYGMPEYIGKRMDAINKEIDYYNTLYPNILDDIWTTIFGGTSDRELARKSLQKIEEEKQNLEYLESMSKDMWDALNSLADNNHIIKF